MSYFSVRVSRRCCSCTLFRTTPARKPLRWVASANTQGFSFRSEKKLFHTAWTKSAESNRGRSFLGSRTRTIDRTSCSKRSRKSRIAAGSPDRARSMSSVKSSTRSMTTPPASPRPIGTVLRLFRPALPDADMFTPTLPFSLFRQESPPSAATGQPRRAGPDSGPGGSARRGPRSSPSNTITAHRRTSSPSIRHLIKTSKRCTMLDHCAVKCAGCSAFSVLITLHTSSVHAGRFAEKPADPGGFPGPGPARDGPRGLLTILAEIEHRSLSQKMSEFSADSGRGFQLKHQADGSGRKRGVDRGCGTPSDPAGRSQGQGCISSPLFRAEEPRGATGVQNDPFDRRAGYGE